MELSDLEVINGGVERLVVHLDGSGETIKVRQLPLRRLSEYGRATGDEPQLIELFTGKDAAWVDSLTIESAEEIVTVGDALNLDPFVRWSDRRLRVNDQISQKLKAHLPAPLSASANSARPSVPAAATPSSSSAS